MKKPRTRAHHKQKLRAKRRQQKRHIKRIVVTHTLTYGLPAVTQALSKMGNAMHKVMEEMSTNMKPFMEKVHAAHQEWEQKKLAHAKAYGKNHFLATNYMAQSMAAAMGNNSNVGPNLVRKHRKEFNQEVVHPDPQSSHVFGSTFHISPLVKGELNNVIMDLNDNCGWTREQIADWLDTLDDQPIFYPNTCPDDCECEECKPPKPVPHTYDLGGWLKPETLLSAEEVANLSITSEKIQNDAITYAKMDAAVSKGLFQFSKATAYEPTFSYEVVEDDYNLVNDYISDYLQLPHNPIYKGAITVPNEWKMQQNPHELTSLYNYLQKHGGSYYHDAYETTFELEGSQAEIKATLHTVQEFMKGMTHELPAHSCTCTIEHPGDPFYQGKHCSYHGK